MALFGLIPDFSKGVTLRMTPNEARIEAIGKALGLVGTTMGAIGTVMALTANPAVKETTDGVYSQLPKEVQDNKIIVIMGLSALGAIILARRIRIMSQNNSKARYK